MATSMDKGVTMSANEIIKAIDDYVAAKESEAFCWGLSLGVLIGSVLMGFIMLSRIS